MMRYARVKEMKRWNLGNERGNEEQKKVQLPWAVYVCVCVGVVLGSSEQKVGWIELGRIALERDRT